MAGAAHSVFVPLFACRHRREYTDDDERDRPHRHQIPVLRIVRDRGLSRPGRDCVRDSLLTDNEGKDGLGCYLKKPRARQPHPQPPVYLYLLRRMRID